MDETGTSAWKVAFFESLQAWYGGSEPGQSLDFASEGEAVIWARTQEMGRFRLAAVTQGNLLRALYLEPPPDPILMRQERVEIPAVAPAD